MHEHTDDAVPAAAGAPARLHARFERERASTSCAIPASVGAELVDGRPRRRRHVSRARPARRLPDRLARGVARRAARRRRVRAPARGGADRRARRLRHHGRHGRDGYTGVWVGDEKIAAIGVRVARGPHPPRLRAQRRSRPRDVRPHRAVRHPRPWRHVDGAAARRPRRRCAPSSTASSRASPRRSGSTRSSAKTSRGSAAPTSAPSADGGAPVVSPVRLLGRLAAAGVEADPEVGARPARVDAGAGPASTTATSS